MIRIINLLFFFSILVLPSSGLCQTLGFSLSNGRRAVDIPIEINNNLIIIPVTLNGMLPLKFILDTGVRTTILTEKAFADILHLTYSRKYTIAGLGGETLVDAFVTNNVSLDLPGVHGEGHAMLVLAEDYLQLKNYLGTDVHGILGYELFSRFVIKIDYERKILSIINAEKFRVGRKYQKIPIHVEDTKPFVMANVIQLDGSQFLARLLFDTGASHSIMLEPTSNSAIIVPNNSIRSLIGRGLAGVIEGKVGRVKSVTLGIHTIMNPIANFPNPNVYADSLKSTSIPRNGSIGGEILSRFTVIFDFSHEFVYFKKNHSFKKAFYYNLSGLTIKAKGELLNIYEITEIRSQSASDKAGIMLGDLIVSINGIPCKDLKLNQVVGYFNSKPGRKIRLEINRNGEKLKKEFVLEDQI